MTAIEQITGEYETDERLSYIHRLAAAQPPSIHYKAETSLISAL